MVMKTEYAMPYKKQFKMTVTVFDVENSKKQYCLVETFDPYTNRKYKVYLNYDYYLSLNWEKTLLRPENIMGWNENIIVFEGCLPKSLRDMYNREPFNTDVKFSDDKEYFIARFSKEKNVLLDVETNENLFEKFFFNRAMVIVDSEKDKMIQDFVANNEIAEYGETEKHFYPDSYSKNDGTEMYGIYFVVLTPNNEAYKRYDAFKTKLDSLKS